MTPATPEDYLNQTNQILNNHLDDIDTNEIGVVHINLMSRGDPLLNKFLLRDHKSIFQSIEDAVHARLGFPCPVQFKISTIFPRDVFVGSSINDLKFFIVEPMLTCGFDVEFYYSLYSTNLVFRKRWLPKALDPSIVGSVFKGYEHGIRLHHALIKGYNDSLQDAGDIHAWLNMYNIKTKMNIVSYNPYDESCGEESDRKTIENYRDYILTSDRVELCQLIDKRGPDVSAACGMFVT